MGGNGMKMHQERGSSLIEVMVSLFVLAIGLLGVLALQTRSVQYNQSAYSYSQAAYLANDLAERIRANAAVRSGTTAPSNALLYDTSTPAAADCSTNSCTLAQMVQADLQQWQSNISQRLPYGTGDVENFVADGRTFLRITVSFDDSRLEGKAPDPSDPTNKAVQSYALTMEI